MSSFSNLKMSTNNQTNNKQQQPATSASAPAEATTKKGSRRRKPKQVAATTPVDEEVVRTTQRPTEIKDQCHLLTQFEEACNVISLSLGRRLEGIMHNHNLIV